MGTLNRKITDYLSKISQLENDRENDGTERLQNKIKNLEMELELEQNRHKAQPKNEKIFDTKPKKNNIINWIKGKDIYNED
jgi:hypothetical protein